MLERQCHHTLSPFCMHYYFNALSVQTSCRAQDCDQNLASVKSHMWTSPCFSETVWTIHEEQLVISVWLKRISWPIINWNSMDCLISRTPNYQLKPQEPHIQCWNPGIFALKQDDVKDSSARPASPEGMLGAHGDCTKCFGSRSLAVNATFPWHITNSLHTNHKRDEPTCPSMGKTWWLCSYPWN